MAAARQAVDTLVTAVDLLDLDHGWRNKVLKTVQYTFKILSWYGLDHRHLKGAEAGRYNQLRAGAKALSLARRFMIFFQWAEDLQDALEAAREGDWTKATIRTIEAMNDAVDDAVTLWKAGLLAGRGGPAYERAEFVSDMLWGVGNLMNIVVSFRKFRRAQAAHVARAAAALEARKAAAVAATRARERRKLRRQLLRSPEAATVCPLCGGVRRGARGGGQGGPGAIHDADRAMDGAGAASAPGGEGPRAQATPDGSTGMTGGSAPLSTVAPMWSSSSDSASGASGGELDGEAAAVVAAPPAGHRCRCGSARRIARAISSAEDGTATAADEHQGAPDTAPARVETDLASAGASSYPGGGVGADDADGAAAGGGGGGGVGGGIGHREARELLKSREAAEAKANKARLLALVSFLKYVADGGQALPVALEPLLPWMERYPVLADHLAGLSSGVLSMAKIWIRSAPSAGES